MTLGDEEGTSKQEMIRKTPMLYILCGIPFAGKTTLAKELSKTLGGIRIDLDEVKFEFLGKGTKDDEVKKEQWDEVYQQMYKRIKLHLENGETVIHDTGNFTKHERDLVRQIAEEIDIPTATIWVKTDEGIARERRKENERAQNRFSVSEKSFNGAVAEMEPPTASENVIIFDAKAPVQTWITQTFSPS